ncbi:unnamed protein product [Mucor hiemalis]
MYRRASFKDLLNLLQNGGRAFRNLVTTDGYIFVVNFSCRARPVQVELDLQDFNLEEITTDFRTYAIDPGRTVVFTVKYTDGQPRSLGIREYYSLTGSIGRSRAFSLRNINSVHVVEHNGEPITRQQIESNTPIFDNYVQYVLWYMPILFHFYSPASAVTRRRAYCGRQQATEEAVNIMEAKSINIRERKNRKTNGNRQWRRRTLNSRIAIRKAKRARAEEKR